MAQPLSIQGKLDVSEKNSYLKIISEIKRLAEQEQVENARKGKFHNLGEISRVDEAPKGKVYKKSKTSKSPKIKKEKIDDERESIKSSTKPQWSKKHGKCVQCKTTKISHRARGLCLVCYELDNRRKHKYKITFKERKERTKPTREQLYELYVVQKMSLREVGEKLRYSPNRISQLLKDYNFSVRTHSEARTIAYDKGKITHHIIKPSGETVSVTHQKIIFNESFFDIWSDEMAYVLGVIFSDGSLYKKDSTTAGRFGVSQKTPNYLKKSLI